MDIENCSFTYKDNELRVMDLESKYGTPKLLTK
jgi:hypothetical protein